MKIISKSKDYYDSVSAYGVDELRIYVRTEETLIDPRLTDSIIAKVCDNMQERSVYRRYLPSAVFTLTDGRCIELIPCVIGFCGKLYPIFTSNLGMNFTNIQQLNEINKLSKKEIFGKDSWYNNFNRRNCEKYFQSFEMIEPFEYLKCPVFVLKNVDGRNGYDIIKNCRLNNFDFQKIKDPFTAFMEIQSFISDILCLPRMHEPIKIKDTDMLQKKGFDIKTSFRKGKEVK